MSTMRKEIDLSTYKKRNQYRWFSTFADPSYGFDVDIDVDAVVRLAQAKGDSFFPYFLFLVVKAVNAIPEMRLREVNGKVFLYDMIHPTWTVMTVSGVYQNAGMPMEWDFLKFYEQVKELTEKTKKIEPGDEIDMFPICREPDVIYSTCIPTLEILGMRHPTPAGNHDSLSVPRILWDRFRKKEDCRFHLTLNITVSHALVDGFPLARCFNLIKSDCLNAENIFGRQAK
jgi:chloramphenicol O-acetyltransferase type A